MRFTKTKPNEKRTRKWFALLPVTIDYDTRWLETVEVEQTYHCEYIQRNQRDVMLRRGWLNVRFLNK